MPLFQWAHQDDSFRDVISETEEYLYLARKEEFIPKGDEDQRNLGNDIQDFLVNNGLPCIMSFI